MVECCTRSALGLLTIEPHALAYVAPKHNTVSVLSATKEDMAALAESNPDFLGQSLGLWDPLGVFLAPYHVSPDRLCSAQGV